MPERFVAKRIMIMLALIASYQTYTCNAQENDEEPQSTKPVNTPSLADAYRNKIISAISVEGNSYVATESVLARLPYSVGESFNAGRRRQAITNLYNNLPQIRNVTLLAQPSNNDTVALLVKIEERLPIKTISIEGNKAVKEVDIRKKINLDAGALDPEELDMYALSIKQLYAEKGFNNVATKTELVRDDTIEKYTAIVTVTEGKKALVKQICFIGNESVSGSTLRAQLFTKEDWVLGFIDGSGSFIRERLDGDKYMIEQYYQNHGHIHAHVTNTDVAINESGTEIILTFSVSEGPQYTIGSVEAKGNDIIPDDVIVSALPIAVGMRYSRERIANCIKELEALWGNFGYAFAAVEPLIRIDEDTKTVSVVFESDLGNKIFINRIDIHGNKKSHDKIIRRLLLVEEGGLLTQAHLELSRMNVESLGFFDPREGVVWRTHRINENEADLELIVHEKMTGSVGVQAGFGGTGVDAKSVVSGLNVKGTFCDRNLLGHGIDFNLEASIAKEEQTVSAHIGQQWLFDKPISGALDFYHRRPTYDELQHITPHPVNEKLTGFGATIGGLIPPTFQFLCGTQFLATLGVDSFQYEKHPQADFKMLPKPESEIINAEYQPILDKSFRPGTFSWFATSVEQNMINHPIHPSHGHRFRWYSKFGIPTFGDKLGFYKTTLDYHWFTPIIEKYNLVFHIHAFMGLAMPLGNNSVPFGELFHIGGQNSVRGFLFGQIGPKFFADTIGAKKALFFCAELIFPITPDMNMKGVIFYDGGAGWDNPYVTPTNRQYVTGNNFDYRHSVGIGLRMMQPMPIRIDWGFKIDPRRYRDNPLRNESSYEVHFGMNMAF